MKIRRSSTRNEYWRIVGVLLFSLINEKTKREKRRHCGHMFSHKRHYSFVNIIFINRTLTTMRERWSEGRRTWVGHRDLRYKCWEPKIESSLQVLFFFRSFFFFWNISILFGRANDRSLQGIEIKDMGMDDDKIFGYNSMSCASSSLKSLIDDSLSDDIPFPVPPFSWSLNASSVAYFLT